MSDDLTPIYYRVSPKVWRQKWSEDGRVLALYLLTSPHRLTEGLFVLPKGYICADLKWSPERLAEPFAELLEDGFIKYDESDEVCLIVGALEYQAPANENVGKAAVRRLKGVPTTWLDDHFLDSAIRYAKPFAELLRKELPERFGESQLFSSLLNSEGGREREASPRAPLAPAKGYCNCGAALQHDGDGTDRMHCPICDPVATFPPAFATPMTKPTEEVVA